MSSINCIKAVEDWDYYVFAVKGSSGTLYPCNVFLFVVGLAGGTFEMIAGIVDSRPVPG